MKIYTKTGDEGQTSLFDNTRVSKAHARVDAYGDIDELNGCVGLVLTHLVDTDLVADLTAIQRDLFALGSELADPTERVADRVTKAHVGHDHVRRLEVTIDRLEGELPPLKRFVLPGGTVAGATLHVARTVCRRAERRVVGLGPGVIDLRLIVYLNRLSDLLFVMARAVNRRAAVPEMEW